MGPDDFGDLGWRHNDAVEPCEPDFALSRRDFLGAMGVSTLATVAWSQDREFVEDDEAVSFTWTTDPESGSRVLDVTLRYRLRKVKGEPIEDTPQLVYERFWRIRPESFGREAEFISRPANPAVGRLRDELRITRVSYGRLRNREIKFHFQLQDVPAKGFDGTAQKKRMVISVITNIWSSQNGATQTAEFELETSHPQGLHRRGMTFRDFVSKESEEPEEKPYFRQSVPADRITNSAILMFNGLIGTNRADKTRAVELRFFADAKWRVKSDSGILRALGGRVRLSKLEVYWPVLTANAQGEQRQAALYGQAEVYQPDPDQPLTFLIGDRKDRRLGLERAPTEKTIIYFRAQPPDDKSSLIRAEAKLDGRWHRVTHRGPTADTSAGPFPDLVGSILERVDTSAKPANSNAAEKAGSISFQARYPAPKDDVARARDARISRGADPAAFVSMQSPLGKITAGPLRQSAEDPTKEGAFPSRDGWPVTALFSWGGQKSTSRYSRSNPAVDLFDAAVAITEVGIALPGAEYSRLSFLQSELRLFYAPARTPLQRQPLGSFVNLGGTKGTEFARLDLARASLRASQSHHLLSLLFRFSDLALSFHDKTVEIVRYNTACDITTRPRDSADDLQPHDTRPVLVVEFPPQHLFEEAHFSPTRPPLLDISLKKTLTVKRSDGSISGFADYANEIPPLYVETPDTIVLDSDNRAHVVDAIATLLRGNEAWATTFRKRLRDEKSDESAVESLLDKAKRKAFGTFAEKVKVVLDLLVAPSKLPENQTQYIGPYAMDVDALQKVRNLFDNQIDTELDKYIADMFAAVTQTRLDLGLTPDKIKNVDDALAAENRIQASVPQYQLFRTFYRDAMVSSFFGVDMDKSPQNALKGVEASSTAPEDVEYLDAARTGEPPFLATAERRTRYAKLRPLFRDELKGREDLGGNSRGRLAQPSRLAFRVNCRDGLAELRTTIADLDAPEDADSRLARADLPFSLDTLTRFRGMELSVTKRAEIVYDYGALGQIGRRDARVADTSVEAMLSRLDFESGDEVSVVTRLADIVGSLKPPTALETAIEIPSRLTLSPHQGATVLTPQGDIPDIYDLKIHSDCVSFTGSPEQVAPHRLWAATFLTGEDGMGLDPGLRAVHSPDLRPAALLSRFADAAARIGSGDGAQTQPPGGPWAPWYISKTQSESSGLSENNLNAIYNDTDRLPADGNRPADVCTDATDPSKRANFAKIVRDLCRQIAGRKSGSALDLKFRAALDARDRHQLVLLSSVWGLPVTGRRDETGKLVKGSSQYEPGQRLGLWDLEPGNAIYRPRTLDVTELVLTALGGTLRHDTGFEPPTGAKYWRDNQSVFNALSVERWQQWTNLGRDIFTEVVYKGFLFPLGVRAALVKVTERIFYMNKDTGHITAPLRQRMFIRVAKPEKLFPAMKEPFGGRRFPVQRLEILTTTTSDIVDPYSDQPGEANTVGSSGRINLPIRRGLIFWPRITKTLQGNIRFELDIDGNKTSLPLIFVDNTAVDHQPTMKGLVDYYNSNEVASPDSGPDQIRVDPVRHIRTLILNGAERRYAPEVEAGSATFQTDHWTLRASGGFERMTAGMPVSGTIRSVAVSANEFVFGPLRQGADQPPFYPAIDTARLHLTQAERLMGRDLGPQRARFDARYVAQGFPASEAEIGDGDGRAAKEREPGDLFPAASLNPNQVIMVIRDEVGLQMGQKGDQSGGVFRPDGYLVALSRLKGAMSQDLPHKLTPTNTTDDILYAISDLFKFDAKRVQGSDANKLPVSGSGSAIHAAPVPSDIEETLTEIRELYKKFFSCDAKILGLVCLQDLIKLIRKFASPDEGLPELSEQMEFGGALGSNVTDAANAIRENVISPLATATRRVRDVWDQIEDRLKELNLPGADADEQNIQIRDIFPELDRSLRDLTAALSRARGETDPFLFSLELGACYSAGQRFLNAVQRAAANPGQAVEEAITSRYTQALGILRALQGNFDEWVFKLLEAEFGDAPNPTMQITEIIKTFVSDAAPFQRELIALPRPPGTISDGGTVSTGKRETYQACLEKILPSVADVLAVVDAFAKFLVEKTIVGAASTGELPDIDVVMREFLASDSVQIAFEAKAALDVSPEDLLQKAKDALGVLRGKASDMGMFEEEFKNRADRLIASLAVEGSGIFEDLAGIITLQDSTVARKIRNRYVLCIILNLADVVDECFVDLVALDLRIPLNILDGLQGLFTTPDILIPDLLPELTGYFDGIRDLIGAVGDLLRAIKLGDFPDFLSALGRLLSGLGVSLPSLGEFDVCTYFDPIWQVVREVMKTAGKLGAESSPCPLEWREPSASVLADPDELVDYADSTVIDALPGGADWSLCKAFLSAAAHTEKLNRIVLTAEPRIEAAVDELIDKVEDIAPADELAMKALEKLSKVKESFTKKDGFTKTTACLGELSTAMLNGYTALLEDTQALASTVDDLRSASELNPCDDDGALDPGTLTNLQALVNLPRDFKALGDRREILIIAIDSNIKIVLSKLRLLQKFDGDWISTIPIAVGAVGYLRELGLQDAGATPEPPEWATGLKPEIEELKTALNEIADDVIEAVQPIVRTLCQVIDVAGGAVDWLHGVERKITEQLDALQTEISTGNEPAFLRDFHDRLRREIDLPKVRQELDRIRDLFVDLEAVRNNLCKVDENGDDPIEKIASFADLVPFTQKGKSVLDLLDAEEGDGTVIARLAGMQTGVTRRIGKIADELRPLLESEPREAAQKALRKAMLRVVKAHIPAAGSPLADGMGNITLPSVYAVLLEKRNDLHALFQTASFFGDEIAKKLLLEPDISRAMIPDKYDPSGELSPQSDQLAGDTAWLDFIHSISSADDPDMVIERAAFLDAFAREWLEGTSTPIVILRNLAELIEDVLSGELFRQIDFRALREEFEDYILELVPTKLRMGFGFDIHLGEEVASATAGIFRPGPDTSLGIDMKFEVDLAPLLDSGSPSVSYLSIGTLGPFDVKLVGDMFDAITLRFASARFESESGKKSQFDIVYIGHKVGPQLEFVEKLQKFLAPKDGSGVILRFDERQPGIEAGYRLQLGDFAVGNLAFTNVGLEATAILPFSDDEALFKASLSSRASPFTLTYAPYGGSGFFAILANVQGIIGFEAGFEFGGSAVFAAGPLTGKGRLMVGLYIRQLKLDGMRLTEISMTFFAGGSASIWIFNFAAALSVKMGMVNGNMSGEATFSFSFSMGLADFEYSVVLFKQEQGGFNGQQAMLVGPGPTRFADFGDVSQNEVPLLENPYGAKIESSAKCQSESWNTFKSYFNDNAEPEGYF